MIIRQRQDDTWPRRREVTDLAWDERARWVSNIGATNPPPVGRMGPNDIYEKRRRGMPTERFHVHNGVLRRGTQTVPGGTPPVVTRPGAHRPSSTIVGASFGVPNPAVNKATELVRYHGMTKLQMLDDVQTHFAELAGLPHSNSAPLLKMFHNYDQSIPSSVATSAVAGVLTRGMHGLLGMKAPFGSVAAGTHTAALTSFAQSHSGSQTIYPGLNHEPGNDAGWNATEAQKWRNDQARFAKIILDNRGSRPIVPMVCVINYDIHPNNKQNLNGPPEWQNPAAEMLALGVNLDEVVYSVDAYDTSPIALGGAENLYLPTAQVVRNWGFKRYAVSEGACKSYSTSAPNDRGLTSAWIAELADVMRAVDSEWFAWFNSGVGNRANQLAIGEGWWIYGDSNRAQFARLCAGLL